MNRRSRMKSTLDSLFSSTKSQDQKTENPVSSPLPADPETDSAGKVLGKPVLEKKAPSKKTAPAVPRKKPVDKQPLVRPEEPVLPDPPAEAAVTLEKEITPAHHSAAEVIEESGSLQTPEVLFPEMKEEITPPAVNNPTPEPPDENQISASAPTDDVGQAITDEEEQLVVFLLAGEAFGISIQIVESIIKKQAITKVPHVDKYILGVTNLRGTVVPVVDLRQRFSLPVQETTKDTRIIVLNTESGKNGIVVDEVMEVMRQPKSAIAPPPMIATNINTSYIQGIAQTDEKLIIMLDMNTILQR